MANRNPLAYTGRVSGSTKVQGDVQFDSSQFKVSDGVVELKSAGVGGVFTFSGDSGSASPTGGQITIAGGEGLTTSVTSNTLTISQDANTSAMQRAVVTLSSSQIKNAVAAPIELVPAQGTGKSIMFFGAKLKLIYGGTSVFTETDSNFAVKYSNASGIAVSETIETTGFIDQNFDFITNCLPKGNVIVESAHAENQSLVLHNVGQQEIGGNAANDNTIKVSIIYQVVEL